jgi:hypothetical protein
MAGYITGAAVLGGELILSLSDGQIIKAGLVQGPQGPKGEPGPMGPTGRDGQDGNGMLHGPGFPRPDVGRDGDFFYDTTDVAIFGPKTGGSWGAPVYLKPQGDIVRNGQEYSSKQLRGPGRGRAFAGMAFAGGGSTMVAVTPGNNTIGLDRIVDNALPLLASATPKLIAGDPKGDVMHVLVFAQAATGSWYGEVVATRDANRNTAEVVAWETPMGTTPPQLDFQASIGVGDVLELRMTSDIDLDSLRGKIIYV